MKPPSIGPKTVAAPPITTATRNSIESWNVPTLVASAEPRREHRQRPGGAGVERAQRERGHLHLGEVDADGLRRGFVVAHGDERPAEAATRHEEDDEQQQQSDRRA